MQIMGPTPKLGLQAHHNGTKEEPTNNTCMGITTQNKINTTHIVAFPLYTAVNRVNQYHLFSKNTTICTHT